MARFAPNDILAHQLIHNSCEPLLAQLNPEKVLLGLSANMSYAIKVIGFDALCVVASNDQLRSLGLTEDPRGLWGRDGLTPRNPNPHSSHLWLTPVDD